MSDLHKTILPLIESRLARLTRTESKIARYFLEDCALDDDLSGRAVAARLGVSEAAMTRFAQKCGFKGYRAFAYAYQPPIENVSGDDHVAPVFASYQELLNKTYAIIDMEQIRRITKLMTQQKRIYVYGKGSSGMVAREMKLRFMRIGLVCEAITDDDTMRINEVMLDADCLVVGISISGTTHIVTNGLQAAKDNGAKTILLTANHAAKFGQYCDEILLFAIKNQLNNGRLISPQFPVLVVLDIVYADIMHAAPRQRDRIWQRTYHALHQGIAAL